jgi:hypothetical protein
MSRLQSGMSRMPIEEMTRLSKVKIIRVSQLCMNRLLRMSRQSKEEMNGLSKEKLLGAPVWV